MDYFKKVKLNRGEITTTLTLIGLGVMVFGTILGTVFNPTKNQVKTSSKAAETYPQCVDSDGGENYAAAGHTDFKYLDSQRNILNGTTRDQCPPINSYPKDNDYIDEAVCDTSQAIPVKVVRKYCRNIGYQRCATNAEGDAYCTGETAPVTAVPPGGNVPTPTTGYGSTDRVDSVQIEAMYPDRGVFTINFCVGYIPSSKIDATYRIDGTYVKTSTIPTYTFGAGGGGCHSETIRVDFTDAYRNAKCPETTLVAAVFEWGNRAGTYRLPFTAPHVESGVCVTTPAATATPTPTSPPGATATPTPTSPPGATATPTPTSPPGATATPTPTSPPGATATPTPTSPPGATATPTPTTAVNCTYEATASVKNESGSIISSPPNIFTLNSSVMKNGQPVGSSRSQGMTGGTIHTSLSNLPASYQGGVATVSLVHPPNYQVVSSWCTNLGNGGCPSTGATDQLSGFNVVCGANYDYGWKVRQVSTPATPTPTTSSGQGQTGQLDWKVGSSGVCWTVWTSNTCSAQGHVGGADSARYECGGAGHSSTIKNITSQAVTVTCQVCNCNSCSVSYNPNFAQCNENCHDIGSQTIGQNCTATCTESGTSASCGGAPVATSTPIPNAPTPTRPAGQPPTATATPVPECDGYTSQKTCQGECLDYTCVKKGTNCWVCPTPTPTTAATCDGYTSQKTCQGECLDYTCVKKGTNCWVCPTPTPTTPPNLLSCSSICEGAATSCGIKNVRAGNYFCDGNDYDRACYHVLKDPAKSSDCINSNCICYESWYCNPSRRNGQPLDTNCTCCESAALPTNTPTPPPSACVGKDRCTDPDGQCHYIGYFPVCCERGKSRNDYRFRRSDGSCGVIEYTALCNIIDTTCGEAATPTPTPILETTPVAGEDCGPDRCSQVVNGQVKCFRPEIYPECCAPGKSKDVRRYRYSGDGSCQYIDITSCNRDDPACGSQALLQTADVSQDNVVDSQDFVRCIKNYDALCSAQTLSAILNNLGKKY